MIFQDLTPGTLFEEIPEKDGGWVFILYQWATNWNTFEGNNNKTVNDYVLSLIKDDAKKFTEFLSSQKGIAFSDDTVFSLKEISRIYSILDLNELANKFKDDPTLSIEEKETINIFLKTHQTYIENH